MHTLLHICGWMFIGSMACLGGLAILLWWGGGEGWCYEGKKRERKGGEP